MDLYGGRTFVDDHDRAAAFDRDTLGLTVEVEVAGPSVAGYRAGGAVLIVQAQPPGTVFAHLVGGPTSATSCRWTTSTPPTAASPPPETRSWGGTLAELRDPAANVLTLLGD